MRSLKKKPARPAAPRGPTSSTVPAVAWLMFGGSGWAVALVLLVSVVALSKGGCSLPAWPVKTPAPIAEPGFRVLVLEESATRNPSTMALIHNAEVAGYLNAKCAKGSDGKTPEWRVLDKDDGQLPRLPELWQKAHARAKKDANGAYPWLLVSNGKTGASKPLPVTKAELLTTLKKYGGE